jgi:hypothetical protein
MQPWMIDAVITVLILGMAYALVSEGAWGATLMFFNVMFAGLITFNFYEPLATLAVEKGMAGSWADFVCCMVMFLICLIILRVITDQVSPGMVRLPKPIYHLGGLVFGLGSGAMMAGILLCVLDTAPVHRKIFGMLAYDSQPPYKQGLDRVWLAFVQRSSGYSFSIYDEDAERDPEGEFENIRVFDPHGAWLIEHQNGRPYGGQGTDDKVPEKIAEAPAAAPGG